MNVSVGHSACCRQNILIWIFTSVHIHLLFLVLTTRKFPHRRSLDVFTQRESTNGFHLNNPHVIHRPAGSFTFCIRCPNNLLLFNFRPIWMKFRNEWFIGTPCILQTMGFTLPFLSQRTYLLILFPCLYGREISISARSDGRSANGMLHPCRRDQRIWMRTS